MIEFENTMLGCESRHGTIPWSPRQMIDALAFKGDSHWQRRAVREESVIVAASKTNAITVIVESDSWDDEKIPLGQ